MSRVPEYGDEMQNEEDTNQAAAPPQPRAPGTPLREAVGGVGLSQTQDSTSPCVRDPSVRTPGLAESPDFSSASDSGSTLSRVVSRHDLQRVKRRLVRMSEHLRDSLKTQTAELWEAIDDEIQERKQESPLFKTLGRPNRDHR